MDLYDNPFSPYAFKVRAALCEKGIAHEKREIRTHAGSRAARPALERAMRELAEGYATSQQPGSLFDPKCLHWRSDRIEFALHVGLGEWLADELARDRAFLSPIP